MRARLIKLHPKTYQRLGRLRREAEHDGAYRVAKRLHAVLLNADGQSSGRIADLLKAPRSKVSQWLANYAAHGTEGLLEGQRSGRPPRLLETQRRALGDIIESGPVAYGLDTGVWTAPMIARIIEEEFDEAFHPAHARKLLAQMGFSVQRPRRSLARADLAQQARWRRSIYPNIKKKPSTKGVHSSFPTKPASGKIPRSMQRGHESVANHKSR